MSDTKKPPAIKKDDIRAIECVHANYFTDEYREHDAVAVKERIYLKDGTVIPNLRMVYDYKKEFWVTREGFQNHTDKKEWEEKKRVQTFSSTQVKLAQNVARALNRPIANARLPILARSPFVYGLDVSTSVLIKHRYMQQWPEDNNASHISDIAVLDLESNMVFENLSQKDQDRWYSLEERIEALSKETELAQMQIANTETPIGASQRKYLQGVIEDNIEKVSRLKNEQEICSKPIISGSLTMKDKVHLAISKTWIKGEIDAEARIRQDMTKYLGEYEQKRNITLTIEFVDNDAQVTCSLLKKAHQWKPDFILIWNIVFDIPKMIDSLKRWDIDPKDVFSDPDIPYAFRYFKWKQGQLQKTTASGKVTSQNPTELWHTVFAPASFYFIDSMCLYKALRVTEAQQPSYGLDAILNRHLNLGKLRFEEADEYRGASWHRFMQARFKIEYLIYNIFDCIGLELLEETINDIKSMRMLLGHSDLHRFRSTPRRLCDDLHFVCLEKGLVIGSTSDDMVEELDKHIISMKEWIITLPSHLLHKRGLNLLEEMPGVETSLNVHIADLDVAGAYPHTESFLNISKETTWREMSRIKGKPETVYRRAALNMSAPQTNAVELCRTVMDMPSFGQLLEKFEQEIDG